MDSISDHALMVKVKEGDLDKLGLLFERYHRRLYHFFYRLTRRGDVSEDLVQTVFERILKYRGSYSGGHAFSTWIFQIARNIHADHYHQVQRKGEREEYLSFDQLEGDDLMGPQEQPENEQLLLLQQAMDQLDPVKKQTLVLSRFQGFKYKEIAQIMDCSESAVKVRIFRAIRELETLVKECKDS